MAFITINLQIRTSLPNQPGTQTPALSVGGDGSVQQAQAGHQAYAKGEQSK